MPHTKYHDTPVFSPNPDYDFEIRTVLGHAVEGASDLGEVLAATAGIAKHDHQAWFDAWHTLAQRTEATAKASADSGHHVSAAGAYLRASTYYGVAVNAVSALADSESLAPTFARQQDTWLAFIAHCSHPVESVQIPYETSTLPGFFFRPTVQPSGTTLVVVNGSDGSLASLWASSAAAALRRGHNVLLFDGPGQQTQLFDHDIPFRPDWENVLTPVYNHITTLDGVDSKRVAVYGISQGGYWVARALAYEHRYAAAITDPGVIDVSASWTNQVPNSLVKLLDEGQTEKFDRDMSIGMELSPATARTWQFRARPYGTPGYAETLNTVRSYTLSEQQAALISTPLLITDPEGEQFWPGQPQQLADLTAGTSTLVHFTAAEGADWHCQPLARGLTAQRVFDWLDNQLD
ncbi:alpha/beta hydrolase family protein [Compostimonas suwonensis]|uniref:Alpha/beta hydrolase family protein n=1 Tax=Compostimonas suwonensis TaxID=1048394 RepID=A0A2M9C3P3_9MICO|nr:prolyl oligopeptidase family serine peptidase [Compostimonas suwonensis]PJJ65109.1 alpha/beta hydrolase family protein [Compostimonas suwonensis]